LEVKNMDATSASDMLTVLQYVDHFYATSWNHLLVYSGTAVAIVGVVIPTLIHIYQRRTMRHERSEIREAIVGQVAAEVRDRMEKEKTLLEKKIEDATKSLDEKLARDRAELEEKSRETEENLRRGIARASGRVFVVQANMMINQKQYKLAAQSILDGINHMKRGDDRINLRRQLVSLADKCFPNMTKAECEEVDEGEGGFGKMMTKIKEWDTKNDYQDALSDARRAFKAAIERGSAKEE